MRRVGLCCALVLGVVLSLATLGLQGCDLVDLTPPVVPEATRLEVRDTARALLWPTDDDGRAFRFVIEGPGYWDQQGGPPGTIQVPPASDAVRSQFVGVGAATVVLPPHADRGLRRQARALFDAMEVECAGLSTYMISTLVDWKDVTSMDDLRARVGEAEEAAVGGPNQEGREFLGRLGLLMAGMGGSYFVLPKTGASDRFFVIGNMVQDADWPLLIPEAPAEAAPVGEVDAQAVVARADALVEAGRGKAGSIVFALVTPRDAPAEVCSRIASLSVALAQRPDVVVQLRSTAVSISALTDTAGLISQLPILGEEGYRAIFGPERP
jgi:hypothetical protein